MINIAQVSKTTLFASFISLSSLITISPASAFTFDLLGTFDDGGTLSGSFDYDDISDDVTNVDITTTLGSTLAGTRYTEDTFFDADSISFTDTSGEIDLNLFFDSPLSSASSSVFLSTSPGTESNEESFIDGTRNLQPGGTATPVPFEPSTNLGILTLLGIMGFNHYRKKLQS